MLPESSRKDLNSPTEALNSPKREFASYGSFAFTCGSAPRAPPFLRPPPLSAPHPPPPPPAK
eukprot:5153-Prorocentrum_minimum.AAC.2